jgi:branched-chain amino acid transport system permease protein
VVELIWGTDTVVFTPPVFPMEPIFIGKIVVGQVYLWAFVASIILLISFVSFFKYTKWGLSMQATADDEMAALSLGVNAKIVYALAWAIAFMASGVGGTLLGNINSLNTVGYLQFLFSLLFFRLLRSGARWVAWPWSSPESGGWLSQPLYTGKSRSLTQW